MTKALALFSTVLGLASVAMGAAGDHIFAQQLADEHSRHVYETALRYHQLYAILTFCMALWGSAGGLSRSLNLSLGCFIAGTVIFSGSLYASLFDGMGALVYATPVGGMTLMAGWVLAGFGFLNRKK
jgi:uncharacterized membrane protein YgdD (TMEM256/DUF423 family)